MKPLATFALLSAAFAVSAFGAATDPVGYVTIPLPGTGGGAPTKLQIASQVLLPGDAYQDSGTITNVGVDGTLGAFIEDAGGTWTAGDYVGANYPGFVVEVTSGDLQGSMSWITGSDDGTGAGQRLYVADDLALANGATFRVLKTFTIASLLGDIPTDDVLHPAGTQTEADTFLLLDPTTGNYTTFYYKNSGIGQGWKSTIGAGDFADYGIHPNDGMLFVRKQAADGELVITGSVKTGVTDVGVIGDSVNNVLNIVSIQHPVDQLTLGTSGLYTGDPATGLKGGATLTEADNVLILDAPSGNYTTYWYKTSGIGANQWKSSAAAGDFTDQLIPSGSGLLIIRKAGPSFPWEVPAVEVAP